jgi:DNA-3-methyladenine glycosylase II
MWKKAEKFLFKDRYIGPLIKKYGPCKIVPSKKKDYFKDLVDSIISQQLSGKAAKIIFLRVEEGIGGISPSNILKTQDRKFRKFGLSRQKTSYLKDLAKRTLEKEIEIKKLDGLSDEDVIAELVMIKGIGRWTAEMFLMFSLARQDVFPLDDLGIRKGIVKLLKRKFNTLKIVEFAERWKPYRTLASWYIWKSLDNQ